MEQSELVKQCDVKVRILQVFGLWPFLFNVAVVFVLGFASRVGVLIKDGRVKQGWVC